MDFIKSEQVPLIFQIFCPISKRELLKGELRRKSRPNSALFAPPL